MSTDPDKTMGGQPPKRREARRIALLVVFSMEHTGYCLADTLPLFVQFKDSWQSLPEFTMQLCESVETHAREIEFDLRRALTNWKLERVGTVERALLKLASAEIGWFPDIPPRVTINEYLELAKHYCGENSPGFLNGILDRLVHEKKKPDVQIRRAR